VDVPERGEERGEDGEAREEGGEMVEVEEGVVKSHLRVSGLGSGSKLSCYFFG